jgi:3-methyladenine DNA glycosylase AlkC
MTCNECKRRVRNSFTDKLNHVLNYHPDRFIAAVSQWPQISKAVGQHIGEQTKRLVLEYANARLSKNAGHR